MSRQTQFKFRLFVAGNAMNSTQALTNLTALCRAYLPDRHSIQVVDVFREPQLAMAEGITLTPTLIKVGPSPSVRIVGNLSQTAPVLQALGLDVVI